MFNRDIEIEQRIEDFVARSNIPHLQVELWHQGQTFAQSYGYDLNPDVDVFEIGSVGKTFTASLLAVLDEQGVVSLQDKVSKYKPELAFADDITLFDLVTHTAGLPSYPFTGLILNVDKALREFSEADYVDALKRVKAPLKTGKVAYSNFGMALLGNLLAEHLGMSYEVAVKTYLLHPLGMNDTHVAAASYEQRRLATGHSGKGKPSEPFSWACFEPAGVWRSTTYDMMLFLRSQMGEQGEAWQTTLRRCSSPAFSDDKRKRMGLAWQIAHRDTLGMVAWHNGQTRGQKSVVMFAPEHDCALVMLSNKIPKLWHHFIPRYSIERHGLAVIEAVSN